MSIKSHNKGDKDNPKTKPDSGTKDNRTQKAPKHRDRRNHGDITKK